MEGETGSYDFFFQAANSLLHTPHGRQKDLENGLWETPRLELIKDRLRRRNFGISFTKSEFVLATINYSTAY